MEKKNYFPSTFFFNGVFWLKLSLFLIEQTQDLKQVISD